MNRNHDQTFRPLRPGVAIYNNVTFSLGTLGLFARSNDGERWLVSCHHVLWSDAWQDPTKDAEEIEQPAGVPAIATTSRARADVGLDVAAARLIGTVDARNDVLGIGPLSPPVAPKKGMRVIKSGAATGVTEGLVFDVTGHDVEIRLPDGFPASYDLSGRGDSGAVWLERKSGCPVALHTTGNNGGLEYAKGVAIEHVLTTLGLTML